MNSLDTALVQPDSYPDPMSGKAAQPGHRIDTCAGFVRALKPYKEAIYDDLVSTADCGPFDGCCLLFANALQSVIGGEVMVLIRAGQIAQDSACGRADHAVVHLSGKLYDFDGTLVSHAFMKRFGKNEHVQIGGFRAVADGDLPEAVRDLALELRVAALLRKALGPSLPKQYLPLQASDTTAPPLVPWLMQHLQQHFGELNGYVEFPGGSGDLVGERGKFLSIYSWFGDHTGRTPQALRDLAAFGHCVCVHDPGEEGTDSRTYWEHMFNQGLVHKLIDEVDNVIKRREPGNTPLGCVQRTPATQLQQAQAALDFLSAQVQHGPAKKARTCISGVERT